MSDALQRAREHRAGLRVAIGRVERSLASAAAGRAAAWSADLRIELDNLGNALDQHIAITESPEGLLADIVEAAPRLAHRVERARKDHVALRGLLALANQELGDDDEHVAASRDRAVDLLTALVRHRHLGADLVYEAYNVDIEALD